MRRPFPESDDKIAKSGRVRESGPLATVDPGEENLKRISCQRDNNFSPTTRSENSVLENRRNRRLNRWGNEYWLYKMGLLVGINGY